METTDKKTVLFARKEAFLSLIDEMQSSALVEEFADRFGACSVDTEELVNAINETIAFIRGKVDAVNEELTEAYNLKK